MRIGIRGRMLALIVLPTLVIYVGVLGLMLVRLEREARDRVMDETTHLAANYAARFDGAFREAAEVARTTARLIEVAPDLSEAQIYEQLTDNVRQDPAIYGAAMAFEPGMRESGHELYSPYVYRGEGGLVRMDINETVYDWYRDERWQWWQIPYRTGGEAWTDPYFDDGAGNTLMVTFSAPFFRDGVVAGVTTVDVDLERMGETFAGIVEEDLRWMIVTREGRFVFNKRRPETIMRTTLFDVIEAAGREDLRPVVDEIVSGESGVIRFDDFTSDRTRQWIFFSPIESTGWVFGAIETERRALAAVHRNARFAALMLTATLVLIVGCIWIVSGRLARPIRRLDGAVRRIAGGDLDARVEGVSSGDEIGRLATSFNAMASDLRANLERLSEERAGREKIERDLDLAREIQRGLLPPKPPRVEGFEIAGWNRAADKTGGDYFDWLELPDGKTIITLADVTGHGIGPALIVAVCRAYMRASASGEADLATVLHRVNDLLYEDIPSGRFVTAAVGVLDPARRSMMFLSAGHAPIFFYKASADEVTSWDADDIPLGIMSGMSLGEEREIRFEPGDVLVLITDGFFEWANAANEQYGAERVEAAIRARHGEAPSAIIDGLYEDVLRHAGGTAQADDLTAVVVKRVGGEETER